MDRQLARMEDQKPVAEVSVGNPADRHAADHGACHAARAEFEASQVLRNPGQQIPLVRGELHDISHVCIPAVAQRQDRTAAWTAQHWYTPN